MILTEIPYKNLYNVYITKFVNAYTDADILVKLIIKVKSGISDLENNL